MSRSFKDRLRQFDRGPALAPLRPAVEPEIDRLLDRGAAWAGTPGESHLRLERRIDGAPPASEAVCAHGWSSLLGESLPPRPWVVVDTETTGLETGAGVLVFLIGLIVWDDDGARMIQLLLPEPSAERALLEELRSCLEGAGALVSYNGKSFDLPRILSRLRLHRFDAGPWAKVPHLDLLHPSRRITRHWLPDARLPSLERALLSLEREDDLPGWEVPDAYRDFLLTGRSHDLVRVLDHNEQDILSLLDLAAVLADCFRGGERSRSLPPAAQFGLARALWERGDIPTAHRCLDRACEADDPSLRRRAHWFRFLFLRRQQEWQQVGEALDQMIESWPGWISARVERAKHLEHRRRDPKAAAGETRRALQLLETTALRDPAGVDRRREELLHRLARLERKTGRTSVPPAQDAQAG